MRSTKKLPPAFTLAVCRFCQADCLRNLCLTGRSCRGPVLSSPAGKYGENSVTLAAACRTIVYKLVDVAALTGELNAANRTTEEINRMA
eukprot:SAG22_NODE_5593_length_988_cov_1.070866_1_plen_88_part_10